MGSDVAACVERRTRQGRIDDRRVIGGILNVLKRGCCWKDCPQEHGPYTTIYNSFVRRARRGVWEHLSANLRGVVDRPRSK